MITAAVLNLGVTTQRGRGFQLRILKKKKNEILEIFKGNFLSLRKKINQISKICFF